VVEVLLKLCLEKVLEAIGAYLKVLLSPRETEGNHRNPHSGYPVIQLKFKTRVSRMQACIVNSKET
jgi:hypothetical protein